MTALSREAVPIATEGWDADAAADIIAAHAALEGAALPILHALQAAFGCVPKESEP